LIRDEEDLAHGAPFLPQHAQMICRMWHGRTLRTKADAYASFLVQRAIPDYRSVPGNIDVAILRRDEGEVTHFLTVTHWHSEEAIRAFAGDELLKAKYYPEDTEFLLEFEPTVQHFVVAALQADKY
jgi:heme-degrading monooxygenase HmoA